MNAHLDLAALKRDAEMLDELCGNDERLFHDMLLGETDIDRIVLRIHEQRMRDEEMLVGIKERQTALADRKKRIEARAASAKAFIGKALRIARLAKLELPEVTYSVRDGKPSLEVVDVSAVPEEYLTYKPIPNKTQINADFDPAGDLPNWLVVREGGDVVTGRTK